MTRIAVLTPDPADSSYAGQWPGVLERLAAALAPAGITVEPSAWTEHVEDASGLAGYPLVLPLIAWAGRGALTRVSNQNFCSRFCPTCIR